MNAIIAILSDPRVKKILIWFIVIVLFILSLGALLYTAHLCIKAKTIGIAVGTTNGRLAGHLSGSLEGVTQGLTEGEEAGKADGLSAQDTSATLGTRIKAIGKLEVLSADVTLHDYLNIGDGFEVIVLCQGEMMFTVDLMHAELKYPDDGHLTVILPEPESTFRLDDEKTRKLASDQRHSWTGTNEDGYQAYMNSVRKIAAQGAKYTEKYSVYRKMAMDSAEKQVSFLIQSAAKEEVAVDVQFKDGTEEDQ